jgi:tetratricopeptide (TPR) repeat protein
MPQPGVHKLPDSKMHYNFPMQFRCRLLLLGIVFVGLSYTATAQDTESKQKRPQPQTSDPLPRSDDDQQSAPPLGDNESSSKQTQIDISPPKDDAAKHPDSEFSDVTEMHTWNPHKAQKDVEVGEFYMKRKNYRAAEDRFREALVCKPGDAIATYRLAEVLDAQGQSAEAVKNYEAYLKIPSSGKFAPEAKKALTRLEARQNPPQ